MGGDICDTKLSLSIRGGAFSATENHRRAATKPQAWLHLCFPPSPKKEEDEDRREKTKPMELENLKIIKSKNKKDEDDGESHGVVRKKLRLTNEQSGQLERSFCSQKTLTSIQKEELAKKVGLRPRQVEVWFQNRRARTKLKQTEVDCELLKRWCENLTDENRRLRGELNELRFYGLKVEDKRVCPSCDRLIMAEEEEEEKTRPVLQLCS